MYNIKYIKICQQSIFAYDFFDSTLVCLLIPKHSHLLWQHQSTRQCWLPTRVTANVQCWLNYSWHIMMQDQAYTPFIIWSRVKSTTYKDMNNYITSMDFTQLTGNLTQTNLGMPFSSIFSVPSWWPSASAWWSLGIHTHLSSILYYTICVLCSIFPYSISREMVSFSRQVPL